MPTGALLMKGPGAATIRAWARKTGRPVGSRGAISAHLHNEYILALVVARLRRAGLAASRLALSVVPPVARAAANNRTPREQ
jgi:hypothetical protein